MLSKGRRADLRDAGTHKTTTDNTNLPDFNMKLSIKTQSASRIQFFRSLPMPELPSKKDHDRIDHNAENWNQRDLTLMDRAPSAEYLGNYEPTRRQRRTKYVQGDFDAGRSLLRCALKRCQNDYDHGTHHDRKS